MLQRLILLFTKPKDYWAGAVSEPGDIKSQLLPQMAIIAGAAAAAMFLGQMFVYMRFAFGSAILVGLVAMVLAFAFNIAIWIALGFIIDALATSFGAQRDIGQSMKLASGTIIPMWAGAVLNIVPLPGIGMLGSLAGLGYGAYALYLGLPIMNNTPQEKVVGYTAATIGILLVLGIIAGFLAACPATCLVATAIVRPY